MDDQDIFLPPAEPGYWKKRLDWCRALIPGLQELSDHERVARLFSGEPCLRGLPEVLAALVPESREFWMRVQAEIEFRFIKGLTALFNEEVPCDEPDKLQNSAPETATKTG